VIFLSCTSARYKGSNTGKEGKTEKSQTPKGKISGLQRGGEPRWRPIEIF
jgi:hypothetical protein